MAQEWLDFTHPAMHRAREPVRVEYRFLSLDNIDKMNKLGDETHTGLSMIYIAVQK